MIKNEVITKLAHISNTKYSISIEVPSDIVDETFKSFYNKAQAKSNIKGFRPGKAPLDMIVKRYQQEVRYSVFDHLVNKFVNKAMQSHQLRLIKQLDMQVEQFSEGVPLKFSVEFEAQKDILIKDTDNLLKSIQDLSVIKEKLEMSKINKMLEHEINRQKEILSVRTPINEIRKMKPGEYSIIDCKCFHNDNLMGSLDELVFMAFNLDLAASTGINKNSSFIDKMKKDIDNTKKIILIPSFLSIDKIIVSFFDEYFNEALKHNLIDMEPGQTKKLPVIYPSDHPLYSRTTFILQVHLKQLCNITLPEVNDTFAKKMGFSSAPDMNEKLKQKYTDLENKRIEEKLQIDLLKELLKQNPISIPEEYILAQKESSIRETKKQLLEKHGKTQSHLIDKQIEAWEKEGRFKDDVVHSISESILIQKLAKAWNLFEPIKKEFKQNLKTNKQFSEIANRFKVGASPFKNIDKKDIMNPILFEMMKRSVMQQIISKATIRES